MKEITINSKLLTINECVDSCEPGSTLLEEGDRKCLRECNSEGKKYKYQSTCVEKCPEGFYFQNNECISSCTTKYFKKIYLDTDNTKYNYQCIEVCDGYVLPNAQSSGKDECIEKCPMGKNFIGKEKKCQSLYYITG